VTLQDYARETYQQPDIIQYNVERDLRVLKSWQ